MNETFETKQKAQIPETYITSGRKRALSSEVKWEGLKTRAEQATDHYQKVLQEAHTDEELMQAQLEYLVANKELELFDVTHDATGAMSSKKFEERLRDQSEIIQTGKSEAPLESQYMFVVNMGELDRLNKEGGHKGGNLGLQKTAESIENVLRSELSFMSEEVDDWSEVYSIYRFTGNEFAININIPLAKELAHSITKKISESRPEVLPGLEPPPLTARHVNMAQIRDVLPESIKNRYPVGEDTHEVMGLTKEVLLAVMEEEKVAARIRRIVDHIADAEKRGQPLDASQNLYEQFLQKSLNGLTFALSEGEKASELTISSFEDVKKLAAYMNVRRGQQGEGLQTMELNELIYGPALKSAMEQVRQQNEKNSGVKERIIAYLKDQDYVRRYGGRGTNVSSELQQVSDQAPKFIRPARNGESDLKTSGQLELEKAYHDHENRNLDSTHGEDALHQKERQLSSLNYEILKAKMDKDTGLGLDAVMYRDTQEALAAGKSVANIGIDMGFLKYFDKVGGKNVGDKAILQAAVLFDEVATKNPPGFIDRLGGATREVSAKAYRPGGDEFNIVITGKNIPEAELKKTTEDMKAWIIEQAKRVTIEPDPQESKPEYKRTSIIVSLGSEIFMSADRAREKMQAFGMPVEEVDPSIENPLVQQNPVAERIFQIADTQLEIQKMYQRFAFLCEQADKIAELTEAVKQDPNKQTELEDAKTHFQQLVLYSKKALGEGGEGYLAQLTGIKIVEGQVDATAVKGRPSGEKNTAKEKADLLLYVFEHAEQKLAKEKKDHADIETKIELIARLQFMERQVEALKMELGEAHQEVDSYKKLVAKLEEATERLKTKAESAEQEAETVKQTRQKIGQAA